MTFDSILGALGPAGRQNRPFWRPVVACRFHVVFGLPWAGPGILVTLGLGGDQGGFQAHYQQITDG